MQLSPSSVLTGENFFEKYSHPKCERSTLAALKLFIVHSHYRPGGVRRVIELAAPPVAAALQPPATEIVLVGGEAPEKAWLDRFRQAFPGRPVSCAIEPALGYISEQRQRPATIAARTRAHLQRCFADARPENCVVWIHNPGLGRNLIMVAELGRIAAKQKLPVIFHHHDWWFDNRWARWPEMQRTGFRTLTRIAETILPLSPTVRHAAINQADARILRRHLGERAGWVPNPADPSMAPTAARMRVARRWLAEQLGDDGPVWLVPCRLLRRKNLAEALLLTRWLRPEASLVTTGAVSSADEGAYAHALEKAARTHGWRLRLAVLARAEATKPSVPELLAASEAILLTSLQEGFGLPILEAAAAHRPLIMRTLPTIAPDLARFGFRFPQSYDDLQVDARLFDLKREMQRQTLRWRTWRDHLPRAVRPRAGKPALIADGVAPSTVAFSRLTLTAQLEVLAHPAEDSWDVCAPLNPFLRVWSRRATAQALAASPWPRGAAKWLSGPAYSRHITQVIDARPQRSAGQETSAHAADEFIGAKLAGGNQYPLLWTAEP